MSTSGSPLSGLRVLDLSRVLAGPVCTQILADLGADVVKVERPGAGDDTRQWGPPFVEPLLAGPPESAYFVSCNRGKRSLALDLGTADGRRVLDDLVRRADVLVENFLPDSLTRFGLEPERLRALNPDLVSCSISAFGRTGSLADVPGYDLMIQAARGLMAITGEPGGQPMKVGVAISDVLTGLYAAVSVLAGVAARRAGGAGRAFDVALADCTLASLVNVVQSSLITGQRPVRYGNAHPQIVPYEALATSDGHLAVAIGADRQWQRFCATIERPDLAADPRFATNPIRVEQRRVLIAELEKIFAQRTTAEWQRVLTAADVPHSPVVQVDEIVELPEVAERGMVSETTDSAGRRYRVLGSPIHWHDEPPRTPRAAPRLGEHTDEVLAEWLGFDTVRIAALRNSGTIA